MRRILLSTSAVLGALAMTACSGGDPASDSNAQAHETHETRAEVTPTQVVVTRTGGLAGGSTKVVFDQTASYPSDAPELAVAKAAQDLQHTRATAKPQGGGDRYEYTVAVTWSDGERDTFYAIDGQRPAPAVGSVIDAAF